MTGQGDGFHTLLKKGYILLYVPHSEAGEGDFANELARGNEGSDGGRMPRQGWHTKRAGVSRSYYKDINI